MRRFGAGVLDPPYSTAITRRIPSPAASRRIVSAAVLCWPRSIREIVEWLVPVRAASCRWVSPTSIRWQITIRASSSQEAIRSCSCRYPALS
jgi:hypothetical protein